MLAGTLKGVISQRLVPRADARPRRRLRDPAHDRPRARHDHGPRADRPPARGHRRGRATTACRPSTRRCSSTSGRPRHVEDALRAATSPHDFKLLVAADGRAARRWTTSAGAPAGRGARGALRRRLDSTAVAAGAAGVRPPMTPPHAPGFALSALLQLVKFALASDVMASNDTCPVCRTAEIVCGKWTLLLDPRPRRGPLALLRARALADRHQPADPLAAPARARGGGHRRAPHLPRGAAARRVRADREGPRAPADHRRHAHLRPPLAGRRRRLRAAAGRRGAPVGRRRRLSACDCKAACAGRIARRPAAKRAAHAQSQLHGLLEAFAEDAGLQLAATRRPTGAEIPFEVSRSRARGSPLYCYRPLTAGFIRSRMGVLDRLPSYAAGRARARRDRRRRRLPAPPRRAAHPAGWTRARRRGAALVPVRRLRGDERVRLSSRSASRPPTASWRRRSTRVARSRPSIAPLLGLALDSDEVALGDGLALARGEALPDIPPEAVWSTPGEVEHGAVLAVLTVEGERIAGPPVTTARTRFRRLLSALRLFERRSLRARSAGMGARRRRAVAASRRWGRAGAAARAHAAERRAGGRAARVLQPRHPPHAACRRGRLGARRASRWRASAARRSRR